MVSRVNQRKEVNVVVFGGFALTTEKMRNGKRMLLYIGVVSYMVLGMVLALL
jgi:hypothetical protein